MGNECEESSKPTGSSREEIWMSHNSGCKCWQACDRTPERNQLNSNWDLQESCNWHHLELLFSKIGKEQKQNCATEISLQFCCNFHSLLLHPFTVCGGEILIESWIQIGSLMFVILFRPSFLRLWHLLLGFLIKTGISVV